jgi:hypothetical protein
MANEAAFDSGFDAGMKKKPKAKTPPKQKPDQKPDQNSGGGVSGWAKMQFKKGGKVPRTGMAKVHKGEVVLTAAQAKASCKSDKKKGHGRKKATTKR